VRFEVLLSLTKLTHIELLCQGIITSCLIAIYPLRLLRHTNRSRSWKKRPFPIAFPAAFDPAPLFYPPVIALFVSSFLFIDNPIGLLPNIILGISSLPRHLIPSTGGLEGSNISQWLLSCLPFLVSKATGTTHLIQTAHEKRPAVDPETLVLLPPLHQALCVTLHYLTTTSLLPAELQLLSIALIDLLLLASSPQAIILKALLWGGGVTLLVTCGLVLKWGVALARVPKWRFRRGPGRSQIGKGIKQMQKQFSLGKLGASFITSDGAVSDSSEDEEPAQQTRNQHQGRLKINTHDTFSGTGENGSVSAIEPNFNGKSMNGSAQTDGDLAFGFQRRHTLPALDHLPPRETKRTPSGRRKRAVSSSVQSFFALTQAQATLRKWLYAVYVYVCVLAIILVGIREYVSRFALQGNEPIGWALGYLFGDLPWFRMEAVMGNLQRWTCLPPRSGLENQESCHLGWVEHLRHASFGEANTRLILCAYWLGIIIVGLAVVFQLSAVYEVDTRRKVFHFMMVAMLLPATFVDPTFAALALSLMLAIFLLLDLFRASQLPPLSKHLAYFLTPYVDGRDLKGPVVISHIFLLIGCAIPLWLSLGSLPRTGKDYLTGWEVPIREVSMVSGVICVGLGDAAASLIGRRFGRRKWLWGGGKSIEGSVAFATAVGLALILAKAWLRIGGWPANNDDTWFMTVGKAGVAAWVASLTEAVLTGGNDNVVVPVVLWLCVKGLDI
jgi:dolichol kinase